MKLKFKETVESDALMKYIKKFKKEFDDIFKEFKEIDQLSVNELFDEYFGEWIL